MTEDGDTGRAHGQEQVGITLSKLRKGCLPVQRMTIVILIALLVLSCGLAASTAAQPEPAEIYMRARVLDIEGDPQPIDEMIQLVTVQVRSGPLRGRTLRLEHARTNHPGYDINVEVGKEIILRGIFDGGEVAEVYIESVSRDGYLKWLLFCYLALILVIGGVKGVKSVVALAMTGIVIFAVFLPTLLHGYNPIIAAVISSALMTSVILLTVGGSNRKTLVAIAGTTGGITIAGILAQKVGIAAQLTGFSDEAVGMLLYTPQAANTSLDLRGLLFAGIILGALGAIMDVAMSIASSMSEIKQVKPDVSARDLFRSGMNVGRDIMGTMSNTLILAYTGSAIPVLLVFMAYDTPLLRILNMDFIATEIIRALAGSIGLILAIPLTAIVGSYLFSR